jgi:transposase
MAYHPGMNQTSRRVRIVLNPTQRAELAALQDDPTLTKVECDRVEMVVLSDGGLTPRQIAERSGYHVITVRQALRRYRALGTAVGGLRNRPTSRGATLLPAHQVQAALVGLLRQERPGGRRWTCPALAAALAAEGMHLSPGHVRQHLVQMGAVYGVVTGHRLLVWHLPE